MHARACVFKARAEILFKEISKYHFAFTKHELLGFFSANLQISLKRMDLVYLSLSLSLFVSLSVSAEESCPICLSAVSSRHSARLLSIYYYYYYFFLQLSESAG